METGKSLPERREIKRGLAASPAVFGQPALRLDRSRTAHAGGGDRLAVDVVGAVARDVDAGDVRLNLRAVHGFEVAVLVDLERRREGLRVRHVADRDENPLTAAPIRRRS